MSHQYADIMFTDSVKAAQAAYGSREHNDKLQKHFGPNGQLGVAEKRFIDERDSFYLATVNEEGWPYLQHRGGPVGFLKLIGDNELAFADFRGNSQLISAGNLVDNDRCSLFFMDYPHRRRLKMLGRIRAEHAEDVDANILEKVALPGYQAEIERVFFIRVEAFDWNCPQHITPRYSENEIENILGERQAVTV